MKKHIIFSNWNFDEWENYAREFILENRADNGDDNTEISDCELWDEIAFLQEIQWDDERAMMQNFFEGKTLIVCGTFGSWRGALPAGKVITYDELWKCWKDCDYIELYDEGGHFYIRAAHHDGTNHYEVKLLTEKGVEYYDNWENSYTDRRSEQEIHEVLFGNSHYTHIPHYAREVFGCKTR